MGLPVEEGKDAFCEIFRTGFLSWVAWKVEFAKHVLCKLSVMWAEPLSVSIACSRDPNKNQMLQIKKHSQYVFEAYINTHQLKLEILSLAF